MYILVSKFTGTYCTLYKPYAVWWRVFSMEEAYHQFSGGTSSVRWRICSMMEGMQYGPVTSISMDGGCAVQHYQSCSGGWWLHLSGKNDILHTILP